MKKQLIDRDRERIVVLSQDPKTIFSYGLQVGELIKAMPEYQFHVISMQYLYGKPFELDGYVTWANEGEYNRCTKTLKKVIGYTDPMCVFSMGDIHHNANIWMGKPLQVPWVSWFPWDNHDIKALSNARQLIETPNIKIIMSKFSYDLLKEYKFGVDGMIYNIVNTDVFKPNIVNKEMLRKKNPKIKDKKILLFVGRPSWRKNIEFLLGAFKDLCNMRDDVLLYLHVDFKDEGVKDKADIRKIIHGMSLNDKIIYTPENRWTMGIDANFLARIYNMSDIYVSTNGGEGFNLPAVEAMSCGVPFVMTDCTTGAEFSGDGKRGLLAKVSLNREERGVTRPWVNIKDFVEKINYLLDNDVERKKKGRAGHHWVRKNCSHKVIAKQWRKLFKKLVVPICSVDEKTTILEWSDKYVGEFNDL